jgi:RNA polymerase sigma-70 factor (TIGR02943 family)
MTHPTKPHPDAPPTDPHLWVDRHGDYLYRYALARVRRPDVAEDVVQDTLLAAWRGRDGFAGAARERTWLTAILKRKVIDWLRRAVRDREEDATGDADEWVDQQFTRLGEWRKGPKAWVTPAPPPESGVERAEFWAAVHGCSDKLPAHLRDVFVLWHLEERPAADVCEAAGVTTSNLWVMLHRARLRMWRCLSQNWYGLVNPTGEGRVQP